MRTESTETRKRLAWDQPLAFKDVRRWFDAGAEPHALGADGSRLLERLARDGELSAYRSRGSWIVAAHGELGSIVASVRRGKVAFQLVIGETSRSVLPGETSEAMKAFERLGAKQTDPHLLAGLQAIREARRPPAPEDAGMAGSQHVHLTGGPATGLRLRRPGAPAGETAKRSPGGMREALAATPRLQLEQHLERVTEQLDAKDTMLVDYELELARAAAKAAGFADAPSEVVAAERALAKLLIEEALKNATCGTGPALVAGVEADIGRALEVAARSGDRSFESENRDAIAEARRIASRTLETEPRTNVPTAGLALHAAARAETPLALHAAAAAGPPDHLAGSVGRGGLNQQGDIATVQRYLNLWGVHPVLVTDGVLDAATQSAIIDFQHNVVGLRNPDGRIDADGVTWRTLSKPPEAGVVLTGSVGEGADNHPEDVEKVKARLEAWGIHVGGGPGDLAAAIGDFQAHVLGFPHPDKRVDWDGRTWKKLIQEPSEPGTLPNGFQLPAPGRPVPAPLVQSDWDGAGRALLVEPAAIRALFSVESGPHLAGFLADGRPPILFEGHIFSRLTGHQHDRTHPTISYPHWTKQFYKGGAREYSRLEEAFALDAAAALKAASWGAPQILGENFRACGSSDVFEFVEAMSASTKAQLEAFVSFVKSTPGLAQGLRDKDWEKVARIYNGPGFAANQYDTKLRNAYQLFSS